MYDRFLTLLKVFNFSILIKRFIKNRPNINKALDQNSKKNSVLLRIEFCFEYNPIQKWEKFSGVPDCNPEYTIFGFFEVLGVGVDRAMARLKP